MDEVILPSFSALEAARLDYSDLKNGMAPKFARSIPVDFNFFNSGVRNKLPDGSMVWRIQITSAGALGLVPVFSRLYLPEGATLHVYGASGEEVIGAFTHENTLQPRGFCAGLIHGESCIIEYFEPAEHTGEGILQLESIGHAYRLVKPLKANNASRAADSCEVNINCEEGADWQAQKRSVVLILVVDGQGEAYCSGSMVNNTKNDCTPYLLSAQHCSENVGPGDYSQWVFYFNYESPTCEGKTGAMNQTVNGCTKVADSQDNGGDFGSDFLLLKLSSSPPANYNAYLSGWDRSDVVPDSSVIIHHPDGDIKKISTSLSPPNIISWGEIVDSTHFEVVWEPTTNGHGVTEAGSSGAPLFNTRGRIVGTLTGGDSFCEAPFAPDAFGRIYFHWDMNDQDSLYQLKPWLDPENTGALTLDGRASSCLTAVSDIGHSGFSFEVFPNPTSGWVQLLVDEADDKTISLFDVSGRKISETIYSAKTISMELSPLHKGIYFIEARSKGGWLVKRVVLN